MIEAALQAKIRHLEAQLKTVTEGLDLCVKTLDAARNHIYDDARQVSEHMHNLVKVTKTQYNV